MPLFIGCFLEASCCLLAPTADFDPTDYYSAAMDGDTVTGKVRWPTLSIEMPPPPAATGCLQLPRY